MNSEIVKGVSEVTLGVPLGALGHHKELPTSFPENGSWKRGQCGENMTWIDDFQLILFQYEPILDGKFLIIFSNFEKKVHTLHELYTQSVVWSWHIKPSSLYFCVAWREMHVDIEKNTFYRWLKIIIHIFSKMRLLTVLITDSVKETIKITWTKKNLRSE